jgi:hypothetical protein
MRQTCLGLTIIAPNDSAHGCDIQAMNDIRIIHAVSLSHRLPINRWLIAMNDFTYALLQPI